MGKQISKIDLAINLAKEINENFEHCKQISIDADAPSLKAELSWCNSVLARSGQIKADAEKLLNAARGEASEEYLIALNKKKVKFNATLFNVWIENKTQDEQALFMQADRLNAVLVHRIDSIRTNLSYEKLLIERSQMHGGAPS